MSSPPLRRDATPTWPLPLLQRLAQDHLVIPREPDKQRLYVAAAALGRTSVAAAHALARVAVDALAPGDFLGCADEGGGPIDLYRLYRLSQPSQPSQPAALGAACCLGLEVFCFEDRPEPLLLLYLFSDGPPALV